MSTYQSRSSSDFVQPEAAKHYTEGGGDSVNHRQNQRPDRSVAEDLVDGDLISSQGDDARESIRMFRISLRWERVQKLLTVGRKRSQ